MDIAEYFEKGKTAVQRKNYGYALEIFQQILVKQPQFNLAREALRSASLQHLEANGGASGGKKVGAFFKGMGAGLNALTGKPEQAVIACEKYLANDPTNTKVLAKLGENCVKAGYTEAALMTYEFLMGIDSSKLDVYYALAELYTESGSPQKAQAIYQKALKQNPKNADLERKVRDLAAISTMQADKWDSSGDFRDKIKDQGAIAELEKADKIIRTEDDLAEAIERAIQKCNDNPEDCRLWISLGDLYKRKNDLQNAFKNYKKAKEIDAIDPNIDVKIGDLKAKEYDMRIAKASKQDDKAALTKLKSERQDFMVAEYKRRIKSQPTVIQNYFDLGKIYLVRGQNDEAIAQFQQTAKSPKLKIQSCNYLGICFRQNKMYEMSENQLNKALDGQSTMNDLKKEILYNLGQTFEQWDGHDEQAIATYSSVYEEDINYKDIADRIKAIREKK